MPSTPSSSPPPTGPSAPPGAAARSPGIGWLGVVGFALLIALLGALFVQARQALQLQQTLDAADERVVVDALQAEIHGLELKAAWRDLAQQGPGTASPAILRLHFQNWQASVRRLEVAARRPWFDQDAAHRGTLDAMGRLANRAALSLGETPSLPMDAAFLESGLRELEALHAPVRAMSQFASAHLAELARTREQSVRRQNQERLALTAFLAALTGAFAWLALHQVHQLRQRRVALESLARSLARARQDAEAASRSKSAFLANMSHEIRTPFHGLLGMLSLLRETGLSAKQTDYLRTATESADHLLVILNDILDMSQLESGRLALSPQVLDLRALLREVEALMRPQAMARKLSLHVDIAPELPEQLVLDGTRVKQILFNLLSNAIKFTERGEVTMDLRVREPEPGAMQLSFTVSDSGIGMDEATLAQLFKRFAQGDSSRSRRYGGTGLGLEISRNLARLMGGDITVSSRQGEGSRFALNLPMVRPSAASVPGQGEPTSPQSPRRLRLLVAEDHPVNRQYLEALLEAQGHETHHASNGAEAVEALRSRSFDLVLMDLHMPGMDGLAATRAIRSLPDPSKATVPIVALTADGLEDTHERCRMAGMNDFLTKPVSPARLATLLRQFFGGTPGGHEGTAAAANSPPQAVGSTPLLDQAAIAAALQGMPRERFAVLLRSFFEQGPLTVQHLRAAVRDAQTLELRVNAHAVRGVALNLGLGALANTAQALHEGASHLAAHEVARLVQRYEDELKTTREAVEAAGLLQPARAPDGQPAPSVTE